jgi:hypothetical protein
MQHGAAAAPVIKKSPQVTAVYERERFHFPYN